MKSNKAEHREMWAKRIAERQEVVEGLLAGDENEESSEDDESDDGDDGVLRPAVASAGVYSQRSDDGVLRPVVASAGGYPQRLAAGEVDDDECEEVDMGSNNVPPPRKTRIDGMSKDGGKNVVPVISNDGDIEMADQTADEAKESSDDYGTAITNN